MLVPACVSHIPIADPWWPFGALAGRSAAEGHFAKLGLLMVPSGSCARPSYTTPENIPAQIHQTSEIDAVGAA